MLINSKLAAMHVVIRLLLSFIILFIALNPHIPVKLDFNHPSRGSNSVPLDFVP